MSDEYSLLTKWREGEISEPEYRRRLARLDTQSLDPLPLSVHVGDTEGMADQLRKERKESPCPKCGGKGTYRKDGPSEEEFDSHATCYACNGWGVA